MDEGPSGGKWFSDSMIQSQLAAHNNMKLVRSNFTGDVSTKPSRDPISAERNFGTTCQKMFVSPFMQKNKCKEYNICLSVCIEMQRIPLMLCWHLCLALLARLMCVSCNCPADRGLYCICNYTGKSVPLSCGLVTLCVSTEKGHAGSPSEVSRRIWVQSVPPPALLLSLTGVLEMSW